MSHLRKNLLLFWGFTIHQNSFNTILLTFYFEITRNPNASEVYKLQRKNHPL